VLSNSTAYRSLGLRGGGLRAQLPKNILDLTQHA